MRLELLDYLRHLLAHSIVFGRTQLLFPAGRSLLGWESWAASPIGSCHASAHSYQSGGSLAWVPPWGLPAFISTYLWDLWDLSSLSRSFLQPEQTQDLRHHLPEAISFVCEPLFFSTSHSLWHPKPPVSLINQSVCKSTTPDQLPNWWLSLMSFY